MFTYKKAPYKFFALGPKFCWAGPDMILLFAITLLCLQPTTSVPPTNLTDHLALLKFKESIDDDPHGFLI